MYECVYRQAQPSQMLVVPCSTSSEQSRNVRHGVCVCVYVCLYVCVCVYLCAACTGELRFIIINRFLHTSPRNQSQDARLLQLPRSYAYAPVVYSHGSAPGKVLGSIPGSGSQAAVLPHLLAAAGSSALSLRRVCAQVLLKKFFAIKQGLKTRAHKPARASKTETEIVHCKAVRLHCSNADLFCASRINSTGGIAARSGAEPVTTGVQTYVHHVVNTRRRL